MWSPETFEQVRDYRRRAIVNSPSVVGLGKEFVEAQVRLNLTRAALADLRGFIGVDVVQEDLTFDVFENTFVEGIGAGLTEVWCHWWPASVGACELFGGELDGLEIAVPPPVPTSLEVPMKTFILEDPTAGEQPTGELVRYSLGSWKPTARVFVFFPDARVGAPA